MKICKTATCTVSGIENFWRDKTRSDGLSVYCKDCMTAKAKARRERMGEEAWRREQRRIQIKHRYGITPDQFEQLDTKSCPICLSEFDSQFWRPLYDKEATTKPCVDHCHTTGNVRGIICTQCNRAMGQFGDDPDRLMRAAEYLERAALLPQ